MLDKNLLPVSGVTRPHGKCGTSPIQQRQRTTNQLLQRQSVEDMGCPASSVYTEASRHVPQGTRRYAAVRKWPVFSHDEMEMRM